jgi:ubiquinone/menaquinone biosynthesis C-methylase UbiE
MHIPDQPKALSELARVLNSGGKLVISESNMHSLQAVALRARRRLLRKQKAEEKKSPWGLEY